MATETGEGTTDADESVSEPSESTVDTSTETVESDIEVDDEVDTTEEARNYDQFTRSAIVTTVSTLSGVAVAFASALYVGDPESPTALLLVAAAVFVQFPIYKLMGMNVDTFGMKGKIYIAFMTFILWFLTWGLILTTGATDAL